MRVGLQAWGSEGDIAPFLALGSGLVRAGHTVKLVVTDNIGRDYSHHTRQGGVELVSVPLPHVDGVKLESVWREIIEIGNPLRQAELVLEYGYDPVANAMLDAAKVLVAESDAVVGHFFAYPLQIAAELAGKPAATLAIVHNCVPTMTRQAPGLPDLGAWSHRLGWWLAQRIVNRMFLPRYNSQRKQCGLAPLNDTMTEAWASQQLNLLAVSPSICQQPPDWASHHVVTGFINESKPTMIQALSTTLQDFIDQGDPPVFIGFGSMMLVDAVDYAKETIAIWQAAVTALGIRAVFQLPEALLGLVQGNEAVLAVAWADYRLLFPRCSVIVHHGGAGTTQSALRAGRPAIIVAHVSDQFFWGQELERLGVAGPTLHRKGLTATKLDQALRSALGNRSLAPNAQRLGQTMARERGVETAISAIENRLFPG